MGIGYKNSARVDPDLAKKHLPGHVARKLRQRNPNGSHYRMPAEDREAFLASPPATGK